MIAAHEAAHRHHMTDLLALHDTIVARGTPPSAVELSTLRTLELQVVAAAQARLDAARGALQSCEEASSALDHVQKLNALKD